MVSASIRDQTAWACRRPSFSWKTTARGKQRRGVERAAWQREKGDSLENAILSGLGKRDGRALIISTSAADDMNTFSRWLDQPPPGAYVQEHRPPSGLPADDLESLLMANPGASEGIGSSPDWLVSAARTAIARGGAALSSFRNLNRNERVSIENKSVLITVDEWLSAEVAPDDLPARNGPCVLGVDLNGSRSMSAAAFYWPDTGRLEALGTFPAYPSLKDRSEADGVSGRYLELHERGELSVLGENTVPPGPWLAEVVRHLDGIPVPLAALETRAGETVAADVPNPKTIRPIIDRIFPNSVAERLGIERINITSGELAFPVATAGAVFGWQMTELGNVGGPQRFETAERSLSPDHTGGAQMVISRKALKQAGDGLEQAIRRDLNAAIGAELDRVAVNGSGANGEGVQ